MVADLRAITDAVSAGDEEAAAAAVEAYLRASAQRMVLSYLGVGRPDGAPLLGDPRRGVHRDEA